jgi:opacity protein-like surface antigen
MPGRGNRGKFVVPNDALQTSMQDVGDANYFTIAPAGGVDYRLQDRRAIRMEYEYQFWLNSPGYSSQPDHPLRPNGFHAGISYRIFH